MTRHFGVLDDEAKQAACSCGWTSGSQSTIEIAVTLWTAHEKHYARLLAAAMARHPAGKGLPR